MLVVGGVGGWNGEWEDGRMGGRVSLLEVCFYIFHFIQRTTLLYNNVIIIIILIQQPDPPEKKPTHERFYLAIRTQSLEFYLFD